MYKCLDDVAQAGRLVDTIEQDDDGSHLVRLQQHVLLALRLVAVADAHELLREGHGPVGGVEGEQVRPGVYVRGLGF